MARINITAVLILFSIIQATGFCANPQTLPEGYPLNYIQGEISGSAKDQWSFKTTREITEGKITLKAGTTFKILPSSTLEKIVALIKTDKSNKTMRLQANIIKHKNQSYLFATSYILMSVQKQAAKPEPNKDNENTQKPDKPKKESILSNEIKELLTPTFTPNLKQNKLPKNFKVKSDYNLVNRTGFLITTKDGKSFMLDGLGRKREKSTLKLLPCTILELIENKTYDIPGRRRYKVSGIVTRYQGQDYLLLQRIVRTYNHGNFAR